MHALAVGPKKIEARARSRARDRARILGAVPARLWRLEPPVLRLAGPAPHRPTRREFLIGTGGLLALAPYGCGGEEARSDGAASSETRTVEHLAGETEVPVSPERVVVLEDAALETALAVGVEPIGAPSPGSLGYLGGRLPEGTEEIGANYAPNLERIARLEPDLVLGSEYSAGEPYDQLSRVAPTIVVEVGETTGDWKRVHARYAEALGRAEEGERVMERYHSRLEEFKRAVGDLGRIEVSVMRASAAPGNFRVDQKDLFNGTVLEDAGLSRPPSQAKTGEGGVREISLERLDLAEGDVLFVYTSGGTKPGREERAFLADLKENPLWERLDVVRRGDVHEVGQHWIYTGPISADLIVDDLFDHLVER